MSLYIIPTIPGETNYDFGTTINGVGYNFLVYWNDQDFNGGAFYFSVFDVAGNPIAQGIKVVLGTYLGRRVQTNPLFTNGVFTAYDTSGKGVDCGINELGGRILLLYIPNVDLMGIISSSN
jgi:hypothetical protein